jgi:hypothetical protein
MDPNTGQPAGIFGLPWPLVFLTFAGSYFAVRGPRPLGIGLLAFSFYTAWHNDQEDRFVKSVYGPQEAAGFYPQLPADFYGGGSVTGGAGRSF